ncbi:mavicyanin-like [Phragmites australis]|uniref:mavicyanin-like n=1 Tax=Phragmites australis TaxID=29695 RepID=UPI002D79B470|nr:mavicyanin-like [Phragmites australis]
MARISSRSGALAVAAVMAAAVFGMASAATYNVGEPGGSWDLQTNYANWVSSKRFHPGDQIVFKYSPQAHDVLEVNEAGYDSCSTSNPIATHNSGNDAIALTSPGTRYFICGFPTHCTNGMKLKIDVLPGATSPAPAGAPSANSPPPPSTPASAATKGAAATGFGLAVMFAAGLMA